MRCNLSSFRLTMLCFSIANIALGITYWTSIHQIDFTVGVCIGMFIFHTWCIIEDQWPNKLRFLINWIPGSTTHSEYDHQKALELIDGVYEIVEVWDAQTPHQKKWKEEWLQAARELGARPM